MVSCGGGTLKRCGKWWDGSCMRVLTRCYMGGEKRILWKCLLEEEDDDATKNTVSLDKKKGYVRSSTTVSWNSLWSCRETVSQSSFSSSLLCHLGSTLLPETQLSKDYFSSERKS